MNTTVKLHPRALAPAAGRRARRLSALALMRAYRKDPSVTV